MGLTKQDLIDFENEIERIYNTGVILAPVHLRDGCEDQLIGIFEEVKLNDYVFSTWASHLHALLKGIPPEKVKEDIIAGRSITLMYPEHRFYTSAIVGGICPIAMGVAFGLKRNKSPDRVWAFLGDMTFMGAAAQECIRYSYNHNLPITWVIEDNGKSVCTDTAEVWGETARERYEAMLFEQTSEYAGKASNLRYYKYNLTRTHSGTGTYVTFKGM
jgi:TPP-dependent pyruvate/acetoin dehydrogenase alpha subunit